MRELDARVFVVTGGTAGVGKEIVRGLIEKGATVVAVARDAKRGESVAGELGAQFLSCDLTSMASIRRSAAELRTRFPKIHGLVHNAALVPRERSESAEGMELAFAANTAAPWLLTQELLPSLVAGAPSRVVLLVGASAAIGLDDLQLARFPGYNGWIAYQRSKFLSLCVLKKLAETLPRGVVVHGAFPGIVNTSGMDDVIAANTGFGKVLLTLMKPFMRTPQRGAFAPVWVASTGEDRVTSSTGRLWTWREPLERGLPEGWDDPALVGRVMAEIEAKTALPVPAAAAS